MFHVIHAAKASQYSSVSNYIAKFRPPKSKLRFFSFLNKFFHRRFIQCFYLIVAFSPWHNRMTLDYFYGQAGELFSFFRIPKALFYGHCNIIYGQIRQKSLIFFVYLWYHSLRDLHHCSLRLWWRLRHSKKLSEKHNEVTIFETSNFSCLHRCTFLRCVSGSGLHSKNFSACPSANRIL